MKIALLGYGKMGRTIETLAQSAGDEIVLRVDEHNRRQISISDLSEAEVAVEFSRPDAAVANIELALEANLPIVVGTTGWLDRLSEITDRVDAAEGALFWASNFSIGVNIFFAAANRLARLSAEFGGYQAAITETHHTEKLDAPSGTAITLAEGVLRHWPELSGWALGPPATPPENTLPITAYRETNVPGTHDLALTSEVDTITLRHVAHSRTGFARGALTAARWLPGRRGVFTMNDLLNLEP